MVMTEMSSPFFDFSIFHLEANTSHVISKVLITIYAASNLL